MTLQPNFAWLVTLKFRHPEGGFTVFQGEVDHPDDAMTVADSSVDIGTLAHMEIEKMIYWTEVPEDPDYYDKIFDAFVASVLPNFPKGE